MEENKLDIFDRIMGVKMLSIFRPFYKKNKEALLYLFFGGITVLLNITLYIFMTQQIGISILISNIISWIACVFFQFITNRIWVFDGKVSSILEFMKQMCCFFMGRIFTLVIEEVILGIFILRMGLNEMVIKFSAQVVVIVLNYIISKCIVFKKENR